MRLRERERETAERDANRAAAKLDAEREPAKLDAEREAAKLDADREAAKLDAEKEAAEREANRVAAKLDAEHELRKMEMTMKHELETNLDKLESDRLVVQSNPPQSDYGVKAPPMQPFCDNTMNIQTYLNIF